MKFNVVPTSQDSSRDEMADKYATKMNQKGFSEKLKFGLGEFFDSEPLARDFLRARLQEVAAQREIAFTFNVQMFRNAETTPVENTLINWKTSDSPLIPVAKIVLDQQQFEDPGRDKECTSLRFTPGHYHPFHRPAGNMGRGRVFTYHRSQELRGADAQEPNASLVSRWQQQGHIAR